MSRFRQKATAARFGREQVQLLSCRSGTPASFASFLGGSRGAFGQ